MMCIGHDNAVADTVTFKKDTQIDCASVVALDTLVGCEHTTYYARRRRRYHPTANATDTSLGTTALRYTVN